MAQPPGDETRPHSPSKINPQTPLFLQTPPSGPLNNSGTYNLAVTGPIVASGHGQPRLREDGQAYWDDSKPTPHPIIINSSSPPEAGRSPLDSRMNSPESEEPTVPALDTTQAGPATMQAIAMALDNVPEHAASSQDLWNNVPSLPADLPPQPEVIEVRGRPQTASLTPRGRSRANSNASVWSHATIESISMDGSPERLLPQARSEPPTVGSQFQSALQAIKTGMLPEPFNQADIPTNHLPLPRGEDEELDTINDEINTDLTDELARDMVESVIGWGAYTLVDNLDLRKNHVLPFDGRTLHASVAATLLTLDIGGAKQDGETAVIGLTPSSWTRMVLGLLAATIRGALRSPSYVTRGSKSLNWKNDLFPIHTGLDRPLMEGDAIILMLQQLQGLFSSNNCNHTRGRDFAPFPDSYFERLTRFIDRRFDRFAEENPGRQPRDPADLPAGTPAPHDPLTEDQRRQVDARARETLYHELVEAYRTDESVMNQIKANIKDGIFADLNAEAINNADEWRALYKHEFVEAMHDAFEAQYLGIHPEKGKQKAAAPLTTSQVVRDAQPRIKEEVDAQVKARITNIHNEIQESIAANEPFWKGGPLRDAIATTIRTETAKEVELYLADELAAMKTEAEATIAQYRAQLDHDLKTDVENLGIARKAKFAIERDHYQQLLAKDIEAYHNGVEQDIKAWKVHHRNQRDLAGVRRSAERLGFKLVPTIDVPIRDNGQPLWTGYTHTTLEIAGIAIPSAASSRASSPAPSPTTPPNNPHSLQDPNVTPTPVRVKHLRTTDLEPASPLQPYPDADALIRTTPVFYTTGLAIPVAAPLPPPTPMEEDFDYALEVKADAAVARNGGLEESIHAPLAQPTPIPAHNPSAPPRAALLDVQSGEPATAPSPLPLPPAPTRLADLAPAPPTAAGDGLAALLAHIKESINQMAGSLTARLDAQDIRIAALSKSRDPRPKPTEAKSAKGKAVVAATPSPPAPSTSGSKAMDETPAPRARVDDPADETPIELITEGVAEAHTLKPPAPVVTAQSFNPPPDKTHYLTTDTRGKPTPSAGMPVNWASIVTRGGLSQHETSTKLAHATNQGTGRNAAGKARPETVARRAQTGNTEATVIRYRGVDDLATEALIRNMSPAHIVGKTRDEVDRLSGGKVSLLSGNWSHNKDKRVHNFVYTFKGRVSFTDLYPLRDILTRPLLTGHLVPNDRWTHAQLRGVVTSLDDGVLFSNTRLAQELCRNPALESAIFCFDPHWQGNIHSVVQSPRGTVKIAYVDETGAVTAAIKKDSLFMFNERAHFVLTRDSPVITLCGHCHRISHKAGSTACPLPVNSFRCFICGGAHHSSDHVMQCPNRHEKVGECRCLFRCLNCNGPHNARSAKCPMKKGFTPPPLIAKPSPVTTVTPSAKGKTTAPAAHPAEELVPTQRETPSASAGNADAAAETPFTEVRRKGKGRRKANAKIWADAANTSIPGSGASLPSSSLPPPPKAGPSNLPSTPAPSAGSAGKLTSTVPARPAYKGKTYPTPPTWKEAEIINWSHVASKPDIATTLRNICGKVPEADDLLHLHREWDGNPDCEEPTKLDTIQFAYAVKYGFPLTCAATVARISRGLSPAEAHKALAHFEESYGKVVPARYLNTQLDINQSFLLPGEIPIIPVSAEDAAKNRANARAMILAAIAVKTAERAMKGEALPQPPPQIIESALDMYQADGHYNYFSFTDVSDIWETIEIQITLLNDTIRAYA
ncbi:hypothetical protein EDB89DRAFT_2206033 [Lactarius sanguifluus]|nr:hypothetical protein EDB89DRAFT_2206033 [Lactarius sanguifluus]